jgi:hypothetical protein
MLHEVRKSCIIITWQIWQIAVQLYLIALKSSDTRLLGFIQLDNFAWATPTQNYPQLPGCRTQCLSPGFKGVVGVGYELNIKSKALRSNSYQNSAMSYIEQS